jgi:hypothetical protein
MNIWDNSDNGIEKMLRVMLSEISKLVISDSCVRNTTPEINSLVDASSVRYYISLGDRKLLYLSGCGSCNNKEELSEKPIPIRTAFIIHRFIEVLE